MELPSLSDPVFWTPQKLAELEKICLFYWPKVRIATHLKHYVQKVHDPVAFWLGQGEGEIFLEALQREGHSALWAIEQLANMKKIMVEFGFKPGPITLRRYNVKRSFSSPAMFLRIFLYPTKTSAWVAGKWLYGVPAIVEGIYKESRNVIASAASIHARSKIWLEKEGKT